MREPYQNAEIRRARTMAQRTGGRMAARDIEPWDEGGNITSPRHAHRKFAAECAAYDAQKRRNVAACSELPFEQRAKMLVEIGAREAGYLP